MTTSAEPITRRDVWISLLYALGLWAALALGMVIVTAALPTGADDLDWPMIVSALVAALYVAVCWQVVPSFMWFVVGLGAWTLVAFLLLAVLPVEWLEVLFGTPTITVDEIPTIVVPRPVDSPSG